MLPIVSFDFWQKYKLPVVLGGVSIFSIASSVILLVKTAQSNTPIQFSSSRDTLGDSSQASWSANLKKEIHVDVEGGVMAPGLYILPIGSRIDDAIAKAGGLSEEADGEMLAKNINRASILKDGAKIYIPKTTDTSDNVKPAVNDLMTSDNILVNINTSSQNQLESLPGVGPKTAAKIIDNRPFQTLEELISKKAIGNALFEKIKGNLSL